MGVKSYANAQVVHPAIFLPDLLVVCHPSLAAPWGGQVIWVRLGIMVG
jgi:hypothetical protein